MSTRRPGRPPNNVRQAQLLLEDAVLQLTEKAITLAKMGDTRALELCLDRVLPRRPRVHFSETGLRQAVRQGLLTQDEADRIGERVRQSAGGRD